MKKKHFFLKAESGFLTLRDLRDPLYVLSKKAKLFPTIVNVITAFSQLHAYLWSRSCFLRKIKSLYIQSHSRNFAIFCRTDWVAISPFLP